MEKVSVKKAVFWVSFWFVIAMVFCAGIYYFYETKEYKGPQLATQFIGAYLIELSLSVDNLFVFLMVFSSFAIPEAYQRRVLTFGIVGAMVLRLLFIFTGMSVVTLFKPILLVFGLILIVSGIKMAKGKEEDEKDAKDSKIFAFLKKVMPFTEDLHEQKFFVRKNKILHATPLFAILVIIECSDIIFAIDSVPAVLSFTSDMLIAYTSNIFAIMGLRSMYFLLEKMNSAFRYLKYGVAAILTFTGIKLAIPFLGSHYSKIINSSLEINSVVSILIIVSILLISILASVVIKEKKLIG